MDVVLVYCVRGATAGVLVQINEDVFLQVVQTTTVFAFPHHILDGDWSHDRAGPLSVLHTARYRRSQRGYAYELPLFCTWSIR